MHLGAGTGAAHPRTHRRASTFGADREPGGAALAFAVAFALHAGAEPAKDSYKETVDQTFALTAGGTFTIENRNGSIELSTWDKDEVRVVAEKQMKIGGGWSLARLIGLKQSPIETDADAQALFAQLAVEFSGDEKGRTVMTRYPESRDVNCTVSYRITAPRKTKVDLNTVNGSIQVRGVEGEAAVSTTSGSISIEDVIGRVRAVSTNGRVELEGISGAIIAKTTNGSVSASLSGEAHVDDVEMHSVNGSVRLYVPANAAFSIKARTVNGSVKCDLPLASVSEQTRKRLDGVVGSQGAHVEMSTTNGSVQIGAVS